MTDFTPGVARTAGDGPDQKLNTVEVAAAVALEWIRFQAAWLDTVGVQAAMRYRGRLVLDSSFGVADVESATPLTGDHLFRIASHSKTFTATLIAQLFEREQLRLDDTVGEWIPELATSDLAKVTVRELLGHQGGVIRDGYAADYWQRARAFPDRDALIDICQNGGATYEPNQYFKYSNIGYGLLGIIIEQASGQTYAECGESHIAAILELRRTGAEFEPDRADEFASGHTGRLVAGDTRRRIPHVETGALASATGWYSTARELTAYFAAHRPGDERLMSDTSKRLLTRSESQVPVGRTTFRYALGFEMRTIDEVDLLGHSGGYPGHITRSWLDVEADLAVSVFTNAIDGPADGLATGAIGIVRLALKHHEAITPTSADVAGLVGRYANLWGVIDIVRLGGALFLLNAREPDPVAFAQRIIDDGRGGLQFEPEAGFGSVGESIGVERAPNGTVEVVVAGAMSFVPFDDYRNGLYYDATEGWHERMAL